MEILRTPDQRFAGLPGWRTQPRYAEEDGSRTRLSPGEMAACQAPFPGERYKTGPRAAAAGAHHSVRYAK